MSKFKFDQRPRTKNSNEPLTYTVTQSGKEVGTFTKRKSGWELFWLGTKTKFNTKHEMKRHLAVLGHQVEGL